MNDNNQSASNKGTENTATEQAATPNVAAPAEAVPEDSKSNGKRAKSSLLARPGKNKRRKIDSEGDETDKTPTQPKPRRSSRLRASASKSYRDPGESEFEETDNTSSPPGASIPVITQGNAMTARNTPLQNLTWPTAENAKPPNQWSIDAHIKGASSGTAIRIFQTTVHTSTERGS